MLSEIMVDRDKCVSDGVCVAVCPSGTLFLNKDGYPEQDPAGACILCGHCVAACSCGAIAHSGLPDEPFLPVSRELPSPALIDGFLNSRRSVREFKDEPVPRKTLEALLNVARRAPTASNSQTLRWTIVEGKAAVHAVAAETMRWLQAAGLREARLRQWESGRDFVLRGAPTLVVAATPESYGWGKQDCSIALTYMELAAEARGLGVCWAGYLTHVAAEHVSLRQMLRVPEGYMVHGGLMIGSPVYSYSMVPPRKPLSVEWM